MKTSQQTANLLSLLVPEERRQLLVEWNQTYSEYPQHKCIHQLFEEQVERTPNAVAIVFEGQQLTYDELNNRANQLAHYLQELGVKPDVLVGICVERSLEMIIGMLGILKAGGAYVPIDPEYPKERLDFIFEDTQILILLSQEKWLQQLPNNRLKVICLDSEWEKIARNSQDTPVCKATSDSLIYVIYTSGSTGQPKGVMIPHRGICNMLYWRQRMGKLSTSDKVLQTYPFYFDPSVYQIFWPLCFGGQLVLACPDGHKNSTYLVKTIRDQQITIIGIVPSILRFLLEEQEIKNCRSLRYVFCGGETLGMELVQRFYERLNLGNILQNEYGPTEASVITSYWLCQGGNKSAIVPIGRPIDNFQVYILDRDLQPVSIGETGELCISGDGLARGYLNRKELTTKKFIPNPFSLETGARLYKTGDLVRYLPDGIIEFIGRIDNQVKIRGFRIELGEIEAVLSQNQAVVQTVVIVREDLPGDKRLVAYIVPQQKQIQSSDLRSFLQQRLPNYMVPSAFVFLDTMPLTSNGKVDRRALPAPDTTRQDSKETFVAARDDLELQLTKIWEEILDVEPISIRDSFFELGGSSLSAIKLLNQIQKVFNKQISISEIFQAPTVEEFAVLLAQEKSLAKWTSLVPVKPKGSNPPLFCIHSVEPSILHLRHIGEYLDPEQPFYCLQQPALNGNENSIFYKFEDMAAHYINEIQMLQPEGPYFLIGHSMGGLIAYEVASQLKNQGYEVAFLGLIDTYAPIIHQEKLPSDKPSIMHSLYIHCLNISKVQPRRKLGYLLERASNKIPKFIWEKINKSALSISDPISNELPEIYKKMPVYRTIKMANYKARRAYTPKRDYSGEIILYRSIERPTKSHYNLSLGWDKQKNHKLEIYDMPGHHNTIVLEPNVRFLSQQIQKNINKKIIENKLKNT